MTTRVIIAASGPQTKWDGHLGVPSHLAPVDGAPLLARTIAQAHTITDDVHLTAPEDPRYDLPGVTIHHPGTAPSEYAATRPLWHPTGRTILLLGDVYFTRRAIDRIGRDPRRRYQVYGRRGPSTYTGTPYGEIFAVSWWADHHRQMDAHLATVHALREAGTITRPPGWMLLRAWQRTPLNKHRVLPRHFTTIDDLTDDFDCPADYARHPATRGEAAVANVFTNFPAMLARTRVEPRHIIHVGAHEGQEVPYYRQAGIDRITLVEPIPELAGRLRTEHPAAEVVEAACGTQPGPATLHIPTRTNLASLADHGRGDTLPITVQVRTLADLQATTAPDPNIAVIDAQGRELDVLHSADLDALDMVIVETCTVDPTMASDYTQVVDLMAEAGFVEVDRWVRDYDRVAAWAHGTNPRRGGQIRDVVFIKKGLTMTDQNEQTTQVPDYEGMLLADLRKAAHERDLPTSGTKTQLAERLRAADAPQTVQEPTTVMGEGPLPDADPPAPAVEEHPDPVRPSETAPTATGTRRPSGYFTLALPAVRPERVNRAWLDKAARKVLTRALASGKIPCGDVEHVGTHGNMFEFRVAVR